MHADIGSPLSKAHGLKLNKDAVAGLKQLRAVLLLARWGLPSTNLLKNEAECTQSPGGLSVHLCYLRCPCSCSCSILHL